jgi:hypothetical protein
MGRPSKYTPERVQKICNLLKLGNTRKAAAHGSGITEETFSDWRQKKKGFAELIELAEAEFESRNVALIQKAAAERKVEIVKTKTYSVQGKGLITETVTTTKVEFDWAAAAWLLERRRSKDWGKKLDVTSGEQPIKAIIGVDLDRV